MANPTRRRRTPAKPRTITAVIVPATRQRKPVQPPRPPVSGAWLQTFVDKDLRLSSEERLSESAVYAAIRQIVDPLSAAVWNVAVRAKGQRINREEGDLWYKLNVRPNPDQPATAVKETLITSAIVNGSGYAAINRNGAERIKEIWPLEYGRVSMVRSSSGTLFYRYSQPDGEELYLHGSDVVHLRGPTIDGLNGDSLVDRASPAISLAVAQSRFASAFFQNAGVLSGYLKFPNPVSDPGTIKELKETWASKYRGRSAHSVGVIESGGEFVQLSTDAEKAQLRESREMSVQDVARYFGVPLVLLQLAISAQGYGTNTTQFFEMFVRTCLGAWKRRIEEETTFKLCPQREPWPEVLIDLAFLTRGNDRERAETNEIRIRSAQMTPNEARSDEGRDTVADGDVLLFQGKTLADVIDPPEPPAPVLQPKPEPATEPEDEGDEEVAALVRTGVTLALDNHRRRFLARVKDVPEDKVAEARDGLRSRLSDDLAGFRKRITLDQFFALAEQVEAGVEAAKAVEHLLGGKP